MNLYLPVSSDQASPSWDLYYVPQASKRARDDLWSLLTRGRYAKISYENIDGDLVLSYRLLNRAIIFLGHYAQHHRNLEEVVRYSLEEAIHNQLFQR